RIEEEGIEENQCGKQEKEGWDIEKSGRGWEALLLCGRHSSVPPKPIQLASSYGRRSRESSRQQRILGLPIIVVRRSTTQSNRYSAPHDARNQVQLSPFSPRFRRSSRS